MVMRVIALVNLVMSLTGVVSGHFWPHKFESIPFFSIFQTRFCRIDIVSSMNV